MKKWILKLPRDVEQPFLSLAAGARLSPEILAARIITTYVQQRSPFGLLSLAQRKLVENLGATFLPAQTRQRRLGTPEELRRDQQRLKRRRK
jgi:hypothetical protein